MELSPAVSRIRWKNSCRLIPSRYPATGILDRVANPRDLPLMFELESWTNDRISGELAVLNHVHREEWVSGPQATVIMAAFCHPRPDGGRFNGPERGAWYAAKKLETAHAEIAWHRTAELAEIGVFDTRVQMRLYYADFSAPFHDLRADTLSASSYRETQETAARLFSLGSNGVLYRSVREPARGECLACFRPKLIANVRPGPHFEYRWQGSRTPSILKSGT